MTTPQPPSDGDTPEDTLRRHSEPAAEGADQADAGQDQPREHSEDPAEG